MEFVRTPEYCFKDLVDYPFTPNYVDIDGMRMHYVDEGPRDGTVVLMLHGEPSWSYNYRHMIPLCAKAGNRVIAPDMLGFGKSDKPAHIQDYSYAGHVAWLKAFIDALDLQNIVLVCQDWGSLLGLRLAAEHPDRFRSIVVGNGMLYTGDEGPLSNTFYVWRFLVRYSPWFPISRIMDICTRRRLSRQERHAYDAPYPSELYKAGTRAFPRLVPTTPDNPANEANHAAWSVLSRWDKPFQVVSTDGDLANARFEHIFEQRVPGTKGLPHIKLPGGHFLQEDSPAAFADIVNRIAKADS